MFFYKQNGMILQSFIPFYFVAFCGQMSLFQVVYIL